MKLLNALRCSVVFASLAGAAVTGAPSVSAAGSVNYRVYITDTEFRNLADNDCEYGHKPDGAGRYTWNMSRGDCQFSIPQSADLSGYIDLEVHSASSALKQKKRLAVGADNRNCVGDQRWNDNRNNCPVAVWSAYSHPNLTLNTHEGADENGAYDLRDAYTAVYDSSGTEEHKGRNANYVDLSLAPGDYVDAVAHFVDVDKLTNNELICSGKATLPVDGSNRQMMSANASYRGPSTNGWNGSSVCRFHFVGLPVFSG